MLIHELQRLTSPSEQVSAVVQFLRSASHGDAAWCVWLLSGNRIRRTVSLEQLQEWCQEVTGIPEWLFQESTQFVGDVAETIALLLPLADPETRSFQQSLTAWMESAVIPVTGFSPSRQREHILDCWNLLDAAQRLIFNKLLSAGFRSPVPRRTVIHALAKLSGRPADVIGPQLTETENPSAEWFAELVSPHPHDAGILQTLPFVPVVPAEIPEPATAQDLQQQLGDTTQWIVDWKWSGIRVQILRHLKQTTIWSEDGELLTDQFPEICRDAQRLPAGTILDGELVAVQSGHVLPPEDLRRRQTSRSPGRKLLTEIPVRFVALDLLRLNGQDLGEWPLSQRRERLTMLLSKSARQTGLCVATSLPIRNWSDLLTLRRQCRGLRAEGLLLRYAGRLDCESIPIPAWQVWRGEPLHCTAVLIYAHRSPGRRSGLFAGFTFAVWHDEILIPFARTAAGLSESDLEDIERFAKQHRIERFGPVTSLRPELVFELQFDSLQPSSRHKSGIIVRGARVVQRRPDLSAAQADRLPNLQRLVEDDAGSSHQSALSPFQQVNTAPDPQTAEDWDEESLGGLFRKRQLPASGPESL